jgi:hypothetical protein
MESGVSALSVQIGGAVLSSPKIEASMPSSGNGKCFGLLKCEQCKITIALELCPLVDSYIEDGARARIQPLYLNLMCDLTLLSLNGNSH